MGQNSDVQVPAFDRDTWVPNAHRPGWRPADMVMFGYGPRMPRKPRPAPAATCVCGCGAPLLAAGPSEWFATPQCQRRWTLFNHSVTPPAIRLTET